MREYEVVFDYVKIIVLADSAMDAENKAGTIMDEIAMFYDIDRVNEY